MSEEKAPAVNVSEESAGMTEFYELGGLQEAAQAPAKAESEKKAPEIKPTPEKPSETSQVEKPPAENPPEEVEDDTDLTGIDLLTEVDAEQEPVSAKTPASKPDVMEKRYKDVQVYADKMRSERDKLVSETESLRAENAKLQKAIQEKETISNLPELIPMPPEDMWVGENADIPKAQEQLVKHLESKAARERALKAAEELKGKESEKVKAFKEKYTRRENEAIKTALREFPELKNPESRIHKVVAAYLEEHPEERNAPEYIYNVALKADRFINKRRKPQASGDSASSIMIPGSGAAPKQKPKTHTITELANMPNDKLDELLLKQT